MNGLGFERRAALAPEILTALPNHERLIPSLCAYDLVGFQTGDDAFNFSRYLTRECGLPSRDFNFVVGDRTMRIGVFPVGIETAAFAELAQRSVRSPFVKSVITSLAGRAQLHPYGFARFSRISA